MRDNGSLVVAVVGIVGNTITAIGKISIINIENTRTNHTTGTRRTNIQFIIRQTNRSSLLIGRIGRRRRRIHRSLCSGSISIRKDNPVISTRTDNLSIRSNITLLIQIDGVVYLPVTRRSLIPTSVLKLTSTETDMSMITGSITSSTFTTVDFALFEDFTNTDTEFGNIFIIAMGLDPVYIGKTMLTCIHGFQRFIPGEITFRRSGTAIVNAFHNTVTHSIGIFLTAIFTTQVNTIGSLMRECVGSDTFNGNAISLRHIQIFHRKHQILSHNGGISFLNKSNTIFSYGKYLYNPCFEIHVQAHFQWVFLENRLVRRYLWKEDRASCHSVRYSNGLTKILIIFAYTFDFF